MNSHISKLVFWDSSSQTGRLALPGAMIIFACWLFSSIAPYGTQSNAFSNWQESEETASPETKGPSEERTVDFVNDVLPIFKSFCYDCHTGEEAESGFRLDIKSEAFKGGDKHSPDIVAGQIEVSPLYQMIISEDEAYRMPPGEPLDHKSTAIIKAWIQQGAIWPDGIDEATVRDKSDHWAFEPLARVEPKQLTTNQAHPIDQFLQIDLDKAGLRFNSTATDAVLLRRLCFDLTGLSPTQDQIKRYLGSDKSISQDPKAYLELVDELLQSPHYGERYAQHWLDLVRYADTHGFEVNTERPNAWPYRDYVIEAFNRDTPFDQFIREQLAGDQFGKNAATGFLVSASVLLPGQIGQDDASKRLARQDALDEIINNISQTFLGLSVGCARCHDHKFDPVTAEDYYAMQAFVAGVEYEERPLIDTSNSVLVEERNKWNRVIIELESQIALHFEFANTPAGIAATNVNNESAKTNVHRSRPPIYSDRNIERIKPIETQKVRFRILETNKYEPCVDEFEIYDSDGKNVALKSAGTKVSASGQIQSPNRHDLEFVNDGIYGNSSSWMANQPSDVWLLFELPKRTSIERFEWSRDRNRQYQDRTPTKYVVEYESELGEWIKICDQHDRRSIEQDSGETERSTKNQFWSLDEELNPLPPEEKQNIAPILDQLQAARKSLNTIENPQAVFAGRFRTPDKTYLLNRGDPEQPVHEVQPRFLLVSTNKNFLLNQIDSGKASLLGKATADTKNAIPEYTRPDDLSPSTTIREQLKSETFVAPRAELQLNELSESERRVALANWISDPRNPLTARVIVNRVWQWHFGKGIVSTPSDFGNSGVYPTHPQLLDWLATEFVSQGWSIKSLHRLILTSQAYKQSSRANSEALDIDSDNKLLWRFPLRRIDAESLRDSMLLISGELNLQSGGPGFNLFNQRGGLSGFIPIETFGKEGLRRMIYAHKIRRETDPVFGAFDCPDGGQSAAVRTNSTTPIQALNLFNSQFTLDRAKALADKLRLEYPDDPHAQCQQAFQRILARRPTALDLEEAEALIEVAGLESVIRVLFNTNEFLFVE